MVATVRAEPARLARGFPAGNAAQAARRLDRLGRAPLDVAALHAGLDRVPVLAASGDPSAAAAYKHYVALAEAMVANDPRLSRWVVRAVRTADAHAMKPPRADQALVERGLVESRTRAAALILAGRVFSGERRIDKPGQPVADGVALELRGQDHPWVSRGGVKLAHGLAHFGLSAANRVCLDVGASTGGFTDVLLHGGAARVYAVDVGHGQLAWKLRNDPRVVVRERVNARHLDANAVPEPIGALVCDAAFIGLETVLPAPLALVVPGGWAIALIKPQFEVGPAVAKGGVVRDAAVHEAVCGRIAAWWAGLDGWSVLGVEPSPLRGPEGNREFLIAAERQILTLS